jgi:hypothetical protein
MERETERGDKDRMRDDPQVSWETEQLEPEIGGGW